MRKRNNMKGQAALEFLTTYGWAFLVILVMIGALAYFGVLNPRRFLPEKCVFGTGIGTCDDYAVESGTPGILKIQVVNGFGKNIMVREVDVPSGIGTDCDSPVCQNYNGPLGTCPDGTETNEVPWQSEDSMYFEVRCVEITAGDNIKVPVNIVYYESSPIYLKTVHGDIQMTAP